MYKCASIILCIGSIRAYSTTRMGPMFPLILRNLCAHKISFAQYFTRTREMQNILRIFYISLRWIA